MIYKIANLIVDMEVSHEPLLSQAKDYVYDLKENEKVDVCIKCDLETLEKYHELYPSLNIGECEYVLYGAKFYSYLIKNNGILLHSSCVVLDGKAYLFSAPSGTGKSTHTQLWLKTFKNAKILNDDKPAVLAIDNKIYASGTPFSGKTNLNLNEMYPIQGIAFLKRSKTNYINNMNVKDAIFNILNQTIRPNNKGDYDDLLKVIDKIVSSVKIYEFGCDISQDAVLTSYNEMNK